MMKNFTLILLNTLGLAGFAQQQTLAPANILNHIAETEMKAAHRTANFVANLNTGNYDIGHVTLQLTVDPAQQQVTGVVTTAFTAKESMGTITFDLADNLTVTSVTKNGASLTFTQNANDELVITLPATMAQGDMGTVIVSYNGQPGNDQEAFVADYHNNTPILWTISESYGAKEWWPCKQDLIDKIDGLDVYITAPSQYVAVSNGLEQSQTINGSSKTTHFQHNYPIAAYLVAIAVTNYSVYTQTGGTAPNTFPIINYLYPETLAQSQDEVVITLPIMQFYEQTFEAYPFRSEKYGHAQWGGGGGMEHTTVSFMDYFDRELIAHEMAHQWFGDKVTCGSWKDIWLNEGFATYLSGLVVENQDGNNSWISWKAAKINQITASPDGAVYLSDNDTISEDRIFSSRLTYSKGAMVLNMLRFKLGNTAFYQGLKNYLADSGLAYNYAKTPNFQEHMEEVAGESLTEFFNDWVYNQGFPSYTVRVTHGATQAQVTLTQTQSHPSVTFFEMPVPLRFISTTGQTFDVVVQNTVDNQIYTIDLPASFNLSSVMLNAEKEIITANNSVTLSNEQFSLVNGITLFPNPASGILNAQLPDNVDIEQAVFYNALGQKVLETTDQSQWDVSRLAAGIHFITLATTAGTTQLKFVKD